MLELDLATTEEIFDELKKRFDAVVVLTVKSKTATTNGHAMSIKGSKAELAAMYLDFTAGLERIMIEDRK